MSKKNNKISISALENAIKDNNNTETEVVFEWNGISITVDRFLSIEKVIQFVNTVTDACFNEDTLEYTPEVKDYFIRYCIVDLYTNLSLPSNSKRVYPILYHTNLVDAIVKHIDVSQFESILDSISEKTEHKAQSNIEALNVQMNELYMAYSQLQADIEAAFSGVTPETVAAMTSTIASLDERAIAKAYAQEHREDNVSEQPVHESEAE